MNRTGLYIALGLAIGAGLLFGCVPRLDLTIARYFHNDATHQFLLAPAGVPQILRRAAMWLSWAFVIPAAVAPLLKIIRPNKSLLVSGRTTVFLLGTILLTAIILPNAVFKEHWGRPRPIMTQEFGGPHPFTPWWDPRGANRHNGSFYSGEAATAFWMYAPAALAPVTIRPFAYGAVTIFGLTVGLMRMAFGGHYASDVIAAGIASFLVIWLGHLSVYRSRRFRSFDAAYESRLVKISEHLRTTQLGWLFVAIAVLTVFRLVALRFSIVDLFPDEARYWAWSQTFGFGYYSKPPLIAWIIAATTGLCGNSEACIRSASPLFYAGTALVCCWIARELYREPVGFWAGLCVATATGVVFSARIISTDVPLVFFWAVALLAYVKLIDRPSIRWAVVLGFALGLGLLAKYAMVYFLPGLLLAGTVDTAARRLWTRRELWLALVIAVVTVAPNLFWNVTHGFATFEHTKSNLFGGGFEFLPFGVLVFIGAQFGVCGPVLFTVFLLALFPVRKSGLSRADRILIAFALPPLLLVTAAAEFTSVKANWAAPSALSVAIVASAILVRNNARAWLITSVVIGIALQLTLAVSDSVADRVRVPFLANPDIYHRTMGWKNIASSIRQQADANHARSIATDHGDLLPSLIYYLRDDPRPVLAWPTADAPTNQFELDRPVTPAAAEPLLLVTDRCLPDRLAQFYRAVETLPPIVSMTSRHAGRGFCLFRLSQAQGTAGPLKPTAR